jgi:hypothetical protein
MLAAVVASPAPQAEASNYLGQFCLVLTIDAELDGKPVEIKEGVLRLGLDHMGNDHITASGTLETADDDRPVGGNAELIDDIWKMSLLSTWKRGNDIYHMNLDPETLEGDFSRMRQEFDPVSLELTSTYVTGNVEGFSCADVKPGTVCDELRIPPGHLPPPGACRVWNPSLPPGQQRPPGSCSAFTGNVPAGACLIDQYGIVIEEGK